MTLHQALKLTIEEFYFTSHVAKLRDYDRWVRSRWLATSNINVHGVKMSPREVLPLEFDEDYELIVNFEPSEERIAEATKAWGLDKK